MKDDFKRYLKSTIEVAVPSIIENISNVVVGFADTMMVSVLGTYATAAVGINTPTTWLFNSFPNIFAVGTTVLVSQYFGARNYNKAKESASNGLSAAIILFSILFVILFFLSPYIPVWMGAEDAVVKDAVAYLRIYSFCIIPTFVGRVSSSILRGSGNTKTPMLIAFFVNIVNIVFNYLLIYETRIITLPIFNIKMTMWGAGLGVAGASISSTFSMVLGGCILTYLLFNNSQKIKLSFKDLFKFDKYILKKTISIGLPAAGENFATSIGQLFFQKMVAGLGSIQIAAHHLATTTESISYMPAYGFSIAATTLVGHSIGAKNEKDAEGYGKTCFYLSLLAGVFSGLMLYIFPTQLMSLFSKDEAVLSEGISVLRLIAFVQPMFNISIVLIGVLRGAGDTKVPLAAAIGGMLFVRLISAYIFINVFKLGLLGAWLGMFLDLTTRFIIITIRYLRKSWLKKALLSEE